VFGPYRQLEAAFDIAMGCSGRGVSVCVEVVKGAGVSEGKGVKLAVDVLVGSSVRVEVIVNVAEGKGVGALVGVWDTTRLVGTGKGASP